MQKALKRREPRRARRALRRAFLFLCVLRVLRGSRLLCFLRHLPSRLYQKAESSSRWRGQISHRAFPRALNRAQTPDYSCPPSFLRKSDSTFLTANINGLPGNNFLIIVPDRYSPPEKSISSSGGSGSVLTFQPDVAHPVPDRRPTVVSYCAIGPAHHLALF